MTNIVYESSQPLKHFEVTSIPEGLESINIFDFEFLDFPIRRIFWLRIPKKNSIRGEHAHRSCWQVIIPICNNIDLEVHNNFKNYATEITPGMGVIVPPWNWLRLRFPTDSSVVLVLASHKYDPDDYIYQRPLV
jgi:WxcM-like, C-terminal